MYHPSDIGPLTAAQTVQIPDHHIDLIHNKIININELHSKLKPDIFFFNENVPKSKIKKKIISL